MLQDTHDTNAPQPCSDTLFSNIMLHTTCSQAPALNARAACNDITHFAFPTMLQVFPPPLEQLEVGTPLPEMRTRLLRHFEQVHRRTSAMSDVGLSLLICFQIREGVSSTTLRNFGFRRSTLACFSSSFSAVAICAGKESVVWIFSMTLMTASVCGRLSTIVLKRFVACFSGRPSSYLFETFASSTWNSQSAPSLRVTSWS